MCTPEEDRNLTHGGRGAMEMCSWEPASPARELGRASTCSPAADMGEPKALCDLRPEVPCWSHTPRTPQPLVQDEHP